MMRAEPIQVQAVVTYLEAKSKNWKETNFQVTSTYFTIIGELTSRTDAFPDRVVHTMVPVFVDKLADGKIKPAACAAMTAFCEATSVNLVGLLVCAAGKAHKSPKVQTECMAWLGQTVTDFGLKIVVKPYVEFARALLVCQT